MPLSQANKVVHCIRTLALHASDGMTDGNLLDLYVRQKDEAAFGALVRRHGRMVLGVCRRILGNSHDAEDAFQATFLVLVRKAASIRPAGMVGNWLYGVAHRTALEARRSIAKRRVKEAQVAPRPEAPADTLAYLRPLLDQELPRLPDKYRAVLVLCDLEGRTRKQAAQQLGLPEGTVASRLGRARITLTKRLTRDGVILSSGALAAAMAQDAASASAQLSLVFATIRAATAYAAGPAAAAVVVSAPVAALTEGVLKTMLLNQLKIIVLLLVAIGVAGTGWGNYRTWANDQPAVQGEQQVAQAEVKPPTTRQPEQDKLKKDDGKKASDEKKPPAQDQAKQMLDMVLKGFQAYQASKGKEAERPNKEALGVYSEAFLIAFQVSSEIAKAMGKKAPEQKVSPDQNQAKQVLELMRKGLESYQASKGKEGAGADKVALDVHAEAFLKAFEVASELAKAKAKTDAKLTPEDQAVLDSCGPAFLQAYERAKTLKKALEELKASDGKRGEKALEALDVFLKAGKGFQHAAKQHAKTQAVQQARREIESAVTKVKKSTHDRRTELEMLEEIERVIRQMKENLRERKDGK